MTERRIESTWLPLFKEALARPLPGETSHARMLPPGRSLAGPEQSLNDSKLSSVLVLIFPGESDIFTCLLRRQPFLRHHGGQIGFPGGKKEEEDASLLHTALRETREEIGIVPSGITVLGSLSPLYVSVSGFMIHPFVAWTNQLPDFVIDSNEVEKILLFPILKNLRERRVISAKRETHSGWLEVPAFELEGEIIWGATAMILAELFDILKQGRGESSN